MTARASAVPFSIAVDDDSLADLRHRILRTRWPDEVPGIGWRQGTSLAYLKSLLSDWAHRFDWRARERELNRFSQFRAVVDGVHVHFVHERARQGRGVPLILTHGWPSAWIEFLALVPLLTDPAAHGIPGPSFDVVIPSLPGYGFSDRPARTGVTARYVAGMWHQLMRTLGYDRYAAHGTDFGAAVTAFMALEDPSSMIGIHLSSIEPEVSPYTGPGARPLSDAEREYLASQQHWDAVERGYSSIQSTKPQTVAYGLTDSPAGLAAWLVEKWRSWSDCGGDLDARFSRDFLLTLVTLYWVTSTIASSMRDYYDNRWHSEPIGPHDYIGVPTGLAICANHFVSEGTPPREWAERLYRVSHWARLPRGGHFAAVEEPALLARDIAACFAPLA